MLLLPFRAMPHVVEKLIMLKKGILTRPMDIFDLFYHMRHGPKRQQQHKDGEEDQKRVRYLIQK
jgi:hypothetical protein